MNIADCHAAYILAKRASNLRQYTLNSYDSTLNAFTEWIQKTYKQNDIDFIEPRIVNEYLSDLLSRKKKGATVRQHRNILTIWLEWLYDHGYIDITHWKHNVPCVKCDRYTPTCLDEDQITSLIEALKKREHRTPFIQVRDMAIILMFLDTGMRISELWRLKLNDLNFVSRSVFISNAAKSRKSRVAFFGHESMRYLRKYISARSNMKSNSDYVFLTIHGRRLSKGRIAEMIKIVGRRAGIMNIHPHAFRHTAATMMLTGENAMSLSEVQEILGHSSPEITMRYIHLSSESLKKSFDRRSAIDRLME